MIHFILGRSSSGKSAFIHKSIKNSINQKKIIMLVPEQYTLQAEKELIEGLDSEGIMAVEVMSFNRMCSRLLEETGPLDEIPINSIGKAMVLRSLLDQSQNDLLVFKDLAKKNGFIDKLSQLISNFKRAGIESTTLKSRLGEKQDSFVQRKLYDLTLILGLYEKFMAKGYFDEEDQLQMVLSRIGTSNLLKDSVVYLDGFDSFSSQEYSVIEGLAKVSSDIYLALTLEHPLRQRSELLFEPVYKTYERINKIREKNDLEVKHHLVHDQIKGEALTWFEREFFSQPPKAYSKVTGEISIHLCNDIYDEVSLVAASITTLVRDKQYRYKDISIVTGNIETYGGIVKRIFDTYNIPVFIDEKISVIHHPIIQYILSSLRAIHSGFKYEDVFKWVKTNLSPIPMKDSYQLENYALSRGLRGNRWKNTIEDEGLEEIKSRIMHPLFELKEKLNKAKVISDYVTLVFEFLIKETLPEKIQVWLEEMKNDNALEEIQTTTQIWNKLVEVFDQLVELEGGDEKSLKSFIMILEAGFSEIQLGLIPSSMDQVVVGTIERSKNTLVKAMYVLGLNDGIMPKKYSDEGLILEEEKLYLKSQGLDLETDAKQIMSRDYFATYIALTKATESLALTYALSDLEGKALRPSLYVDQFKRVFPNMKFCSHLIETKDPLKAYTPLDHFNHLSRALRAYGDGHDIDKNWLSVLKWYLSKADHKEKALRLKEGLLYDNQVHSIGSKKAKKLFDLPLKASVSRLENYRRCPYAHFVRYGLKPEVRKKHEIRLPDIGLLFHKTLEAFDEWMQAHKKTWQALDEITVKEVVESLVHTLVKDYNHQIFESSYRYNYLIQKLIRVGKRAIWTLVVQIQQGDFEPYAHEIDFSLRGGMKSVPPIMVALKNGEKILLEGRIDRVDIYEKNGQKYVKIIDYKSGSRAFDLSEVYHGLQLQLMVYLNAILENHDYFKTDLLYPAGVFYFKIDDPMIEAENLKGEAAEAAIVSRLKMDGILLKDVEIASAMDRLLIEQKKSEIIPISINKDDTISSRSKVAEANEFVGLIGHINQVISQMGEEIHEGNCEIKPFKIKEKVACSFCDYKSICQFDTSFNNSYRYLPTFKSEEVLEMINPKEEKHGPLDK
jgi:ATP-dependent helicase/nuclease subunit B